MIKGWGALAALAFVVAGCAGGGSGMDGSLQKLVGQDVSVATARLGPADSQTPSGGGTVYAWNNSMSQAPVSHDPAGADAGGGAANVGGGDVRSFGGGTKELLYTCSVTLAADPSGHVKSYQWSGKVGASGYSMLACKRYMDALGS